MVDVIATGPLTGNLGGGATAQFRVRPQDVVVMRPGGQDRSCVRQRCEQRLVQLFIAQPAVERFKKGVLRWPARCDVVQFDVPLFRPAQDRSQGQCHSTSRLSQPAAYPANSALARRGLNNSLE